MKDTQEYGLAVHVLIDRSGSMAGFRKATVDGFNKYLGTLLAASFPANISLSFFSYSASTVIENKPAYEVPKMTLGEFVPGGGTSMYRSMVEVAKQLDALKARQKVLVVLTDGISDPELFDECKTMIATKRKEGWLFIFLGANQDALRAASGMGIPVSNALTYEMKNIDRALGLAGMATLRFQSKGSGDDAAFSDAERKSVS